MNELARRFAPLAWLRVHPLVADGFLALVVGALALPSFLLGDRADPAFRDPDPLGFLLIAAQSAPLALRRRYPVPVLATVGTAVVVYEAFGYVGGAGAVGVLIALYTVAAHADRRTSWTAGAATLVGVTFALVLTRSGIRLVDFIANYVIFVTAWVLGDNLKHRRERLAELEGRAERLERERQLEADRAAAAERQRIARELHDVVAHSVSVMVVQAQAAQRMLDRDPGRAREALAAIESCGRTSLDELRRALGILRTADERVGVDPQPTAEDLEALVEQVRDAGLTAHLHVEGDEAAAPSAVQLSVYRIAQEALTNVMKHAGPARADVYVQWRKQEVEVRVVDDGRGLAATPRSDSGHGLVGMRERAALFGGELRAGGRAGGGFEVVARLPYEEPK